MRISGSSAQQRGADGWTDRAIPNWILTSGVVWFVQIFSCCDPQNVNKCFNCLSCVPLKYIMDGQNDRSYSNVIEFTCNCMDFSRKHHCQFEGRLAETNNMVNR